MNKKLYVGNLNYATTEADLQKLFAEVGPVASVTVITDRDSGQSKGFGFVEMATEEAAQAAIERLNNHELNARNLTVNEARPPRDRDQSSDRGGRRGGPPRGGSGGGNNRRRY
jgi:RNA recognition motif-containing protein